LDPIWRQMALGKLVNECQDVDPGGIQMLGDGGPNPHVNR
jgi:hypothetical protein